MNSFCSCFICGASDYITHGVCCACRHFLPYIRNPCVVCGQDNIMHSSDYFPCPDCIQSQGRLRIISPFRYEGVIALWIKQIKYRAKLELIPAIAGLIVDYLLLKHDIGIVDYLIPVPMHVNKIKSRGFNQAIEIAKYIGSMLSISVAKNICWRTKESPSQVGSGIERRHLNIKNAFTLYDDVLLDKCVVIFDDVVTSGATVQELAQLLYRSGVCCVKVWCFAKAVSNIH